MALRLLAFLIVSLSYLTLNAQGVAWTKLYAPHSTTATASITPHLLQLQHSFFTVVENDRLAIDKIDGAGNTVAKYQCEAVCGTFSPIAQYGRDSIRFIYQTNPMGRPAYRLVTLDTARLIGNEMELTIDAVWNNALLAHFWVQDSIPYACFRLDEATAILKIMPSGNTQTLFIDTVPDVSSATVDIIPGPVLILSYEYGSGHQQTFVNMPTGTLVTRKKLLKQGAIGMHYINRIIYNQLLSVATTRNWVNGEAYDSIHFHVLNRETGSILRQQTWSTFEHCFNTLNDVEIDFNKGRLLLSWLSCKETDNLQVQLFDFNYNPISNHAVTVANEDQAIGSYAKLLVNTEGKYGWIFENKQNEVSMGNLYMETLSPTLHPGTPLEVNFAALQSSESMNQLVWLDKDTFLLTGIVPNRDPLIFWEEVNYFVLKGYMPTVLNGIADVEEQMIRVYPNPASSYLHLSLPERTELCEIAVHSLLGELVWRAIVNPEEPINVSALQHGMYLMSITTSDHRYHQRIRIY